MRPPWPRGGPGTALHPQGWRPRARTAACSLGRAGRRRPQKRAASPSWRRRLCCWSLALEQDRLPLRDKGAECPLPLSGPRELGGPAGARAPFQLAGPAGARSPPLAMEPRLQRGWVPTARRAAPGTRRWPCARGGSAHGAGHVLGGRAGAPSLLRLVCQLTAARLCPVLDIGDGCPTSPSAQPSPLSATAD